MRILLADDQAKVRSALRLLLEQEPELCVVGEVAEATSLLVQVQAIQPDLVLLDWELPGLGARRPSAFPSRSPGLHLLSILHSLGHPPKVIALSGRPGAGEEALAAGADAFVSKGDPPERLLTTLHHVGCSGEN